MSPELPEALQVALRVISDREWTDVEGIVRTQGEALDREYLRRWALELGVDDLMERVLEPNS